MNGLISVPLRLPVVLRSVWRTHRIRLATQFVPSQVTFCVLKYVTLSQHWTKPIQSLRWVVWMGEFIFTRIVEPRLMAWSIWYPLPRIVVESMYYRMTQLDNFWCQGVMTGPFMVGRSTGISLVVTKHWWLIELHLINFTMVNVLLPYCALHPNDRIAQLCMLLLVHTMGQFIFLRY